MSAKNKDHASAAIIAIVVTCAAFVLFGVVLEILKFAALVKWLMS